MSKATSKRVLVGKLETTMGTAIAIASADFDARVRGIATTPELGLDDEASKYATGDFMEDESVGTTEGANLSFMCKVAPSGTPATVEPKWWKFLKACGMTEKAYTTKGVALQDSSVSDVRTMTFIGIDIERGAAPVGVADTFSGCMGNCVISAESAGAVLQANFDFSGKYAGEVDLANGDLLALTSPDTTIAETFKNITCTVGGTSTFCIRSFSVDLGNGRSNELCASQATAILYNKIDSRAPRLNIKMALPAVSAYGALAKWKAETVATISIVVGAYTFAFPRAQIINFAKVDGSGTIDYDITFKLLRNGTTDTGIAPSASLEILQGARA
jgi:hypothetical protein